ncbi:MAG: hypothetical protein GY903_21035 [Fuerstiella sp.]|nr:hypothetical protein [Fuerstiella sp.]MCP4856975.1 hypothetical protein [Fuerstiella sp.]
MKNLIRMSLFIIARAGLSLAVVAWIVGQWWSLKVGSHSNWGSLASIVHEGFVFVLKPELSIWEPRVGIWPDTVDDSVVHLFFSPVDEIRDEVPADTFLKQMPGMTVVRQPFSPSATTLVAICHWLVTTFFTVFNIALHLIYRKRPETQPCED